MDGPGASGRMAPVTLTLSLSLCLSRLTFVSSLNYSHSDETRSTCLCSESGASISDLQCVQMDSSAPSTAVVYVECFNRRTSTREGGGGGGGEGGGHLLTFLVKR